MTMSRHGAKRFGMTLCDHARSRSAGRRRRQRALKLMRIDDEPLVLGNLVVKRAPRRIRRFSLPIHAAAAGRARSLVNRMNEPSANASTPQLLGREQVVKVADVVQPGGTAMKQIVCDAD